MTNRRSFLQFLGIGSAGIITAVAAGAKPGKWPVQGPVRSVSWKVGYDSYDKTLNSSQRWCPKYEADWKEYGGFIKLEKTP